MQPWRVGAGLTISVGAPLLFLAPERYDYLSAYSGLLAAYVPDIALHAAAALASFFAAIYWLALKLGLGEMGKRLGHVDRGLREDSQYDEELADSLRRTESGHWD